MVLTAQGQSRGCSALSFIEKLNHIRNVHTRCLPIDSLRRRTGVYNRDRLPLIPASEMTHNLGYSALDNQFIMTSTSMNTGNVSSVRGEDSWSWTKDFIEVVSLDEGNFLQIDLDDKPVAAWRFDGNSSSSLISAHQDALALSEIVEKALSFVPRGIDMHNKLITIQDELAAERPGSNTDKDRQLMIEDAPGPQLADLADRSPLSVQKQEDVNPNDRDGDLPESVTAGGV